jgi:hypothetical protein
MSGTADQLQAMDNKAQQNFSDAPADGAVLPCEKKKTWIAVRVIDEDGNVRPDIRVHLTPSGGGSQDGYTPEQGKAYQVVEIDPGQWQIELPEVFNREWRFQ